jgi:hypothetical protein
MMIWNEPIEEKDPSRAKRRGRRKLLGYAGALLVGGGLASYAGGYERLHWQFPHYRIPVPRLPKPFEGMRIIHVSDIHDGFFFGPSRLRELIASIAEIPKDIIVATGDYVADLRNSEQVEAFWSLFREMEAPRGVFSVLGNHDHWNFQETALQCLAESGQDLYRKSVCLEHGGERLWLVGASDLWAAAASQPIDDLLSEIPEKDCRLVLAHNPDSADTVSTQRVDLFLSGHTHGGQIRIPGLGALVLPVENRRYVSGLVRSKRGERVFISQGIGCTGLPLRFAAPPEIPILELVCAEEE